jgi:hypothetical protein
MGKTGASDKPAVLSIGAVVGGTTPAARAWGDAAMVLARDVAELRPAIESPLNINAVFHVPGEVLSPDWEGVRTGTYRRRDNHLMVQVTVPATPRKIRGNTSSSGCTRRLRRPSDGRPARALSSGSPGRARSSPASSAKPVQESLRNAAPAEAGAPRRPPRRRRPPRLTFTTSDQKAPSASAGGMCLCAEARNDDSVQFEKAHDVWYRPLG